MFGLKEDLIVQIYFLKESWKYISEELFVSTYFWEEYLIQIYVVAEWLYKEDSDPSFIYQFNVIELSLLGFYC